MLIHYSLAGDPLYIFIICSLELRWAKRSPSRAQLVTETEWKEKERLAALTFSCMKTMTYDTRIRPRGSHISTWTRKYGSTMSPGRQQGIWGGQHEWPRPGSTLSSFHVYKNRTFARGCSLPHWTQWLKAGSGQHVRQWGTHYMLLQANCEVPHGYLEQNEGLLFVKWKKSPTCTVKFL